MEKPATVRDMYEKLYRETLESLSSNQDLNEEQKRRRSHKFAIENTWKEYNKHIKKERNGKNTGH